jgi:hypothetical protein
VIQGFSAPTDRIPSPAIFTVCNVAYLPRALLLAGSIAKQQKRRLKIVVFDGKRQLDVAESEAEILWIEDLGVPRLRELAFMYDIIEFSTSLKPFIAGRLLETHDSVIFLDPDTCLFGALDAVLEELRAYPIILTPHYTTPQADDPAESDLGMMRFGSFNLGFFAVRRCHQGSAFLNWWSRRCVEFSFMESQFGLSTDQKWVSIAPCFFPELHISFNLGLNVAPWNTFERSITKTSDEDYLVNDRYPLVFFHFSNFDPGDPQYLKKRASCEAGRRYPALMELGMNYGAALAAATERIADPRYTFDYMSNGSYISPTLRRAYAAVRSELPQGHNPFDAAGPVGRFARRNRLLQRTGHKYAYPQLTQAARHSASFEVIYFLMRLCLRVLGPNRFYDLSKLMVFLSIYRRNRGLWKL